MAKRRPPSPPGHPLADRLAGAFRQLGADFRRAPSSRRAKNKVLRAAKLVSDERVRRSPVAGDVEIRKLAGEVHAACVAVLSRMPVDRLRMLLEETIAAEADELKRHVWTVALHGRTAFRLPDLCVSAVARLDLPQWKEDGHAA